MRIAFAGTPAFAASALAALLEAGYEVGLVLSQPDRPAGRGQHLQPSAVRRFALDRAIPALTPASLRPERGGDASREALARLRAYAPDVLVVAAYGLLLPADVLQIPRGLALPTGPAQAINIHASLLPRWRGAAPIVRAIEAGDTRTGITIMQMDAGLDTGPILAAAPLDIGPQTCAGELTAQLAELGGRQIVAALAAAARGALRAQPQPLVGVTYARKVEKREAWIDWSLGARALSDRIRAFDPFPGACTLMDGATLKIWRAHPAQPDELAREPAARLAHVPPGTILSSGAEGLLVACGAVPGGTGCAGALCLTQLQRPGGRRLAARDFLAGAPALDGVVLRGGAQDSAADGGRDGT
jgi:methionyl-tRNA formyltransferase